MKRLLLITGDIAAGKSTFAKILSERHRVKAFCKDDIKEVLGDTVGFVSRAENLKLSSATAALMRYAFAACANLGEDVILEANFHQQEIELLCEIAEKYGYGVLMLMLRGDAGVLYTRFMERSAGGGRHPVHMTAGLEDFAKFREAMDSSRKESVPGNVLPINADDFTYQRDERVLRKIDAFMLNAQ